MRCASPRLARRLTVVAAALALAVLVPAAALAHPLGNFTINHFAAIRIAPDRISLDVVIDRAEIPAFQEVQRLDRDGDGVLSPAEIAPERVAACGALLPSLTLTVAGKLVTPAVTAAGISLPPGAGGLPTMRLVCEYEAALGARISAAMTVTFKDRSFAERIGWREIVVVGDGATVDGAATGGAAPAPAPVAEGVSNRLTAYPTGLLAQPLDMRAATVTVTPGGPAAPAWTAPDAQPIAGAGTGAGADPGQAGGAASVPGGVVEDLTSLIDVTDLTPLAILVSLAIALGLGAIHALSPGHGKTIMAAYLVGAKGSSRQAIGLGLTVTVSHTLGVLALAGITLAASSILPPERFYPILGVVSGALVIVIGASLLLGRVRPMLAAGRAHPHGHEHPHPHGHGHDHGPDGHERGHEHGHEHAHAREHAHAHGHIHEPTEATISWRGLLALGLSGGLVPSASALILLLGSIAAGRVAYGLVLVLGFGVGMAVVLTGIGLLIVNARRIVDRRPSLTSLRRIAGPIQLGSAALVVVLGVVLTGQALTQVL
jgi:ABC-type nickel/cobalt efflux system permease component RcnA